MKAVSRFLLIAVLISAFSFISCKKEDSPEAVVTVKLSNGAVVSGATVKIYSDPTYYNNGVGYDPVGYFNPDEKTLYDIQTTDANGQTKHSFKYESIYSVRVWKPISRTDTLWGEGALILKNDETYEETIIIR